jgi:hypothetical protein
LYHTAHGRLAVLDFSVARNLFLETETRPAGADCLVRIPPNVNACPEARGGLNDATSRLFETCFLALFFVIDRLWVAARFDRLPPGELGTRRPIDGARGFGGTDGSGFRATSAGGRDGIATPVSAGGRAASCQAGAACQSLRSGSAAAPQRSRCTPRRTNAAGCNGRPLAT